MTRSQIVLALVQLAVGWFAALYIVGYMPNLSGLELFVYGAVFAIIVWIVGVVLSQVLKDRMPSSWTLVSALVGGLIGAALVTLLPIVAPPDFLRLLPRIPALAYPLVGAILGYLAR